MRKDPAQAAISAALTGEWKRAIEANLNILSDTPDDIEALNRLARAYSETGNLAKAKLTAKNVLKLDPFNPIATKCLSKWILSKKSVFNGSTNHNHGAKTFLEESGRTKITSLLNLGSTKTITSLDTGDMLSLNAHKHKVTVCTMDGVYVGKLPDDVSARLRVLIKQGYKYHVLVKSIAPSHVKLFIKEIDRPKKHKDTPSFNPEKIEYNSFTPPELVHNRK
jgi:tetratricopeptide (TPR) repeat protein